MDEAVVEPGSCQPAMDRSVNRQTQAGESIDSCHQRSRETVPVASHRHAKGTASRGAVTPGDPADGGAFDALLRERFQMRKSWRLEAAACGWISPMARLSKGGGSGEVRSSQVGDGLDSRMRPSLAAAPCNKALNDEEILLRALCRAAELAEVGNRCAAQKDGRWLALRGV